MDALIEAKKADLKGVLLGVMDDEKIRLREEVQEQIRRAAQRGAGRMARCMAAASAPKLGSGPAFAHLVPGAPLACPTLFAPNQGVAGAQGDGGGLRF